MSQVLRPVVRGDRIAKPVSTEQSLSTGWRIMAHSWWSRWLEVVRTRSVLSDLLAGLTVAAVALPLNVALAVASGLPPIAGLIAGAVGGFVAACFGGAPFQVTGPAAALTVLVLAIAKDFGPTGVAAAAMLIGVIQIGLALLLAGRVVRFVPESVLAGFITGVGLKLLDGQIPKLLGVQYRVVELAQMMHRPTWLHQVSWLAVVSGLFVALLIIATKQWKRFPAAIVGVGVVTFISIYVGWDIARVGAVPDQFPRPSFPVVLGGRWLELIVQTLPLAVLASVESLLSASALDRMVKGSHNSNLELFGQGLANTVVGLTAGMPVTGVIVRSGVNVQSGAKTRLASLLHAVFLAVAVLTLGKWIAQVPLAALAGLLCVIGMRLIEAKVFFGLLRTERLQAFAFATTLAGTASGHLMAGLCAGLAVHAIYVVIHRRQGRDRELQPAAEGIRAVLPREQAEARRPPIFETRPHHHGWLRHVRERAEMASSAFVHDKASIIGRVVLGEHVHIAAGSSVRADEGTPFFIGANSNVQDGVVIHALKDKRVRVGHEEWAVYVGKNVSIAHSALVHGPCYIGDETFIGFKAVVHDSIVGARCFIGIGAVVVGVEIPDERMVPHGTIVDSADQVEKLPHVSQAQLEFNEDVVDVNRGLAVAYHALEATRPVSRGVREEWRDGSPPATWDESWSRVVDKDRI